MARAAPPKSCQGPGGPGLGSRPLLLLNRAACPLLRLGVFPKISKAKKGSRPYLSHPREIELSSSRALDASNRISTGKLLIRIVGCPGQPRAASPRCRPYPFLSSGHFFSALSSRLLSSPEFELVLYPPGFCTFEKEEGGEFYDVLPPRVPVVHLSHLHFHPIEPSSCSFPSAFLRIRLPRTRKTSLPPRTRLASLGEEPPSRKRGERDDLVRGVTPPPGCVSRATRRHGVVTRPLSALLRPSISSHAPPILSRVWRRTMTKIGGTLSRSLCFSVPSCPQKPPLLPLDRGFRPRPRPALTTSCRQGPLGAPVTLGTLCDGASCHRTSSHLARFPLRRDSL